MIALLQRVAEAQVLIDRQVVAAIGAGLLVLLCAESGDSETESDKMLSKIGKLRIFSDDAGKMNRCLQNMDGRGTVGGLLVVSQFTLAADASGGNRPSFTTAARPEAGRRLYEYFVAQARLVNNNVQTGQFGADMQVHLVNDGPVTIPLRVTPQSGRN